MKIAEINDNVFQYGDGHYTKGDYVAEWSIEKGELAVKIAEKFTGKYIDIAPQRWSEHTDSTDAAFASAAAFSLAVGNIISKNAYEPAP